MRGKKEGWDEMQGKRGEVKWDPQFSNQIDTPVNHSDVRPLTVILHPKTCERFFELSNMSEVSQYMHRWVETKATVQISQNRPIHFRSRWVTVDSEFSQLTAYKGTCSINKIWPGICCYLYLYCDLFRCRGGLHTRPPSYQLLV